MSECPPPATPLPIRHHTEKCEYTAIESHVKWCSLTFSGRLSRQFVPHGGIVPTSEGLTERRRLWGWLPVRASQSSLRLPADRYVSLSRLTTVDSKFVTVHGPAIDTIECRTSVADIDGSLYQVERPRSCAVVPYVRRYTR